jgi:hypothetical protein
MATIDTGSYVYRKGVTPVTRTALSTRAKILSYGADSASGELFQIGVISEFSPSHSRTVEARRGIGFGDKIAELIPGNEEPISIAVTRTMLYMGNLMQVFGYKAGTSGIVRSLAHHRFPFDIRHELIIPNLIIGESAVSGAASLSATGAANTVTNSGLDESSPKVIATVYEGCWFQDYNLTYSVDDIILTESGTLMASDVYDPSDSALFDNVDVISGNSSAASTGAFSRRFTATV